MKEKKTILVVEDEPLLSKTIQHLLTLWGYSPLAAQTGSAAIDASRHSTLDLILLDYSLPDMSGFQVLSRLKKELFTAYIPVILLIEKKTMRRELMQKEIVPDDYLMKPVDPLDLRLRTDMVLHRTEHQFHANSLTKLPGSLSIEKEIEKRLSNQVPLSVCHYDIDHFKAFNDAYGYHRGNAVLCQTAHLIVHMCQSYGNDSDFVGHIGGDDFIVLTTPDREEEICLRSIQEFDRLIPFHYEEMDRKKGFLTVKNRMGKIQRFPLMSLSIAVVNNKKRSLENVVHISEVASEIKKFLKGRGEGRSAYLIDRRTGDSKGRKARETDSLPTPPVSSLQKRYKPLGQLLLESQLIKPEQLEEALTKHWRSGCRLGQVLLELKLVEPERLSQLLSEQLGIPYVKIDQSSLPEEVKENLSEEWLKEHSVFPIEKKGSSLSLAMVNPLDRKIIQWVEKKTGCQVRPYLAMERELEERLGKLGS